MTALVLLLLLAAGSALAEPQTIDVVYLKDGTTLRGLIVEQRVGISVKLASAEGIVWTLEDGEIDLIEKEAASKPLAVQYTDVVLLKDGVLFRGSVEEQRPGDSIDLRTSAGALLRIPIGDVWAFVKRKQVVGAAPAPAPAVDAETEPLRIRLQIELTGQPMAAQGLGGSQADGEDAIGGSAREEEIDELEREMDESDHRARDEERRTERQALRTLGTEVSELLGKLLADLQECGGQGGVGWADGPFQHVSYQPSSVAEAASVEGLGSLYRDQLNGMVDRSLEKIPTDEVIAAREQQAAASKALQQLLLVLGWRISRRDFDEIRSFADRIPAAKRQRLYEVYQRRDGRKGALGNAIPFTFVGSWLQGDAPAGILGYSIFVASITLDCLATYAFGDPAIVTTPWGWVEAPNDPASVLFWVGPACYVATYAFGIALPPLRTNAWNAGLAKALRVDTTSPRKALQARVGIPPATLVPGLRGEPRLELRLLSVRL